jgi:predicted ATPase
MNPPVTLSKLIPPTEKQEPETDRYQLSAGIRFIITDILVAPSKAFEKFAKINGYDLITGQKLKYRTTSGPVIQQLETIIKVAGSDDNGHLKQEVKVLVTQVKSKAGRSYLQLEDPA